MSMSILGGPTRRAALLCRKPLSSSLFSARVRRLTLLRSGVVCSAAWPRSSRFGKFLKLYFDKSAKIRGAALATYLLEKSRVTHIGTGTCEDPVGL